MDYLTIIATRSLLLFPSPKPASSTSSAQDDNSPPTTPTSTLPSPFPIAIPISNLLSPDSRLFFFLQKHILRRPEDMTTRDERDEAEVMVWRELAKAGTFLRELGMAVARGEVRESGLKEVARRCGLVLVRPAREEKGQRAVKRNSEGCRRSYAGSAHGSDAGQGEGVAA